MLIETVNFGSQESIELIRASAHTKGSGDFFLKQNEAFFTHHHHVNLTMQSLQTVFRAFMSDRVSASLISSRDFSELVTACQNTHRNVFYFENGLFFL